MQPKFSITLLGFYGEVCVTVEAPLGGYSFKELHALRADMTANATRAYESMKETRKP